MAEKKGLFACLRSKNSRKEKKQSIRNARINIFEGNFSKVNAIFFRSAKGVSMPWREQGIKNAQSIIKIAFRQEKSAFCTEPTSSPGFAPSSLISFIK